MPCVVLPKLPFPALPLPFTVDASIGIPGFSGNLNLCCKIVAFAIPPIPIPIPGILVNPVLVGIMRGAITAVTAYLNLIPLKCPRE